jgi:hypothetical protein
MSLGKREKYKKGIWKRDRKEKRDGNEIVLRR